MNYFKRTSPQVERFPLAQIRLHEGIFKERQDIAGGVFSLRLMRASQIKR